MAPATVSDPAVSASNQDTMVSPSLAHISTRPPPCTTGPPLMMTIWSRPRNRSSRSSPSSAGARIGSTAASNCRLWTQASRYPVTALPIRPRDSCDGTDIAPE
jgi:hypothetical protein